MTKRHIDDLAEDAMNEGRGLCKCLAVGVALAVAVAAALLLFSGCGIPYIHTSSTLTPGD